MSDEHYWPIFFVKILKTSWISPNHAVIHSPKWEDIIKQ